MGTTDGDESPILKFRHTQVAVGSSSIHVVEAGDPGRQADRIPPRVERVVEVSAGGHGVHRALLAAAAMAPASAATWWIQHALNPSVLIVLVLGGAVSLAIYAAVLRVFCRESSAVSGST